MHKNSGQQNWGRGGSGILDVWIMGCVPLKVVHLASVRHFLAYRASQKVVTIPHKRGRDHLGRGRFVLTLHSASGSGLWRVLGKVTLAV
jgi:hypothetical protein